MIPARDRRFRREIDRPGSGTGIDIITQILRALFLVAVGPVKFHPERVI